MSKCKFYVINTQKSQELVDGLHQISMECENKFDAHGFIWIDEEDEIIDGKKVQIRPEDRIDKRFTNTGE